jgi:hypothetical protein
LYREKQTNKEEKKKWKRKYGRNELRVREGRKEMCRNTTHVWRFKKGRMSAIR